MSRGNKRRHRDYMIRDGHLVTLDGEKGTEMLGGAWDQAQLDAWDQEFDGSIHVSPSVAAGNSGYQEWLKNSTKGHPGAPGGVVYASKVCYHVQDEINIGEHSILVTGAHDVQVDELDKLKFRGRALVTPHLGVYLTGEWTYKMKAPKPGPKFLDLPSVEVRGKVPAGFSPTLKFIEAERAAYEVAKAEADKLPDAWRWPHILVGWPDRGVINVDVAGQLVSYILAQLKVGRVIDTGCAGAHGRTGTLLAMLLIEAEELDPESAIKAVRQRHCHKAIESDAQVRAIFGFAGKFATAEEVKRLGR